uniref:Type III-B CRISPR-associated protein Cas10/Cmr2 n=1 Tax=Desulfacinum infernum TaxID=35837 RepID=A0A832A018_9BACT
MSAYCLFQIGPVQEFIQTARKTQDYWAGSFLLSYLNARAIHAFGDAHVIFPHVHDNPLYKAATQNSSALWDLSGLQKADAFRPSLPNRFFAVLVGGAANPKDCLRRAEEAARTAWKQIAQEVYKVFLESIGFGPASGSSTKVSLSGVAAALGNVPFQSTWNEQIQHRSFEFLYAWEDGGEKHSESYVAVEEAMGARKASRIFQTLPSQQGHVCSLCGLRTAIYPSHCTTRETVRDWWEGSVRGSDLLRHRFREGEHLCAVCLVKRLAPQLVFHLPAGEVPSTSTMAVATYHKEVLELLPKIRSKDSSFEKSLLDALDDHKTQCCKAGRAIREPLEVGWPRYFNLRFEDADNHRFFMDGDWFIEDFYRHPNRENQTAMALGALKKLQDIAFQASERVAARLLPPSKYLVLLAADGDNMGKLLSAIETKEQHQKLSELLVNFSTKDAPRVLEEQRPGHILYWGGDEGVAMLPLEDLPEALPALREAWAEAVEEPLKKVLPSAKLTLSVGAVIFHHQYPLRSAIRQVFETLEKAKDRPDKDSWAIRILRRSGAPVETAGPWQEELVCGPEGQSQHFSAFDLLVTLIECYRKDILSPRWLADLRREETALGDVPESITGSDRDRLWEEQWKLFDVECRRLVARHWAMKGKPGENRRSLLACLLQCLNRSMSDLGGKRNTRRYESILAFLDLAHYIAKGGGR